MSFHHYIKAVGTGPKGNRDLTFEEAQDMMTQLLNRSVDDTLISAFLLGWRLKPETIEEFEGALSACDAMSQKTSIENSIELGYPFDGKAKHAYLLPEIAKFLNNKLELVVATDILQPAKNGLILNKLYEHTLPSSNVHLLQRKKYLKALHQLSGLRNVLGLRTAFNTIEKLPNIAQSDFAITGVHHKPYVEKYMKMFSSRYKNFALVQGNEGSAEVFKKATLWLHKNGITHEYIIDPAEYGIESIKNSEKLSKKLAIEQSFTPDTNTRKLAQLNAAMLLFVSDKVATIAEGFEQLHDC